MTEKKADARVWIFSVLGMLFIRLLAHGPAVASGPAMDSHVVGADRAHAGVLNQTIPTMTPTEPAITPPTTEPTEPMPTRELTKPPPTQGPTQPPPEPSGTAIPTASLAPAPTATAEATVAEASPIPTAEAIVTEPPTPVPPVTTESTFPSRTPVRIASQTPPLLTTAAIAGPSVLRSSTPARSIPTPSDQAPLDDTRMPAHATSRMPASPCLWISLGLVLILAGTIVLVRQRSSA